MPGSKQNEPVLGRSIDSAIGFSTINACVNTTGLTAGDILEANFDVNDGTSQVGEKDYRWFVRNSQGMTQGPGGMDETFEVPVISDGYKLTFGVDVQISPVVDGKTYTFADYKVVKQGSTTNLLTHCKDTLATGTLSVSGSAVTGTLDSTPDGGGGGMPSMGSFDSYSCALYAIADTGFVTPVKTASAYLIGQFGPVTNPTCTIGNVASGTYKMGIRGISYYGIGSETILSGSVTVGGSVTPPAKTNPKLPKVATKMNVGRSLTVALHATKGTSSKGANADGLPTVVSVTSASKAFCSVTKVVRNSKITGYTIKGLKAGKCSIVTTVTGNTTFNSLTSTTTVTVAKNAPKIPTVANKVKVKKSFTVKLHATKGTSAKGANSDGLVTVVSVAPASKAFCSVTKVVKNKKITGYTITGLKAGNCSVVVTITGNATFNTITKTTVVKVSN
jgi:hypothetical protein